VKISASACVVDGTIQANGSWGDRGSGGSGGGIRLDVVGSLSGAGTIQAIGGGGDSGGGGGRIAVYFGSMTLPDTSISARGQAYGGSAGTIYLKDNAQANGDVIIDNGGVASSQATPLRTALMAFRSVRVRSAGRLEVASASFPKITATDLTIDGASSFLTTPLHDLGALRFSLSNALTLSNDGTIDVSARGLYGGGVTGTTFGDAGETLSTDGITPASGSTGGSAGSYGGLGSGSTPNATYGIMQNPRQTGSGGSRSQASGLGGRGGGRLWIDAATCSLATGTAIRANGEAATAGTGAQGGGSGGAVKLDCATITGGGNLEAMGGAGAGTSAGGGGGASTTTPGPARTTRAEGTGRRLALVVSERSSWEISCRRR
jgi:hypothetical protein